ncbi:IclR family transcriptional regulator [Natribacillus halophilus]|uniref:DNA-binding transcriptional regulator, IclR family n=1 Tax=Natribacillus halophilus TaxID=549003 RepID=A0A1G8SC75_9BACI|nr:IclR family transcriptional regulator [Natribacillus halophilus]SDJ26846.1 DNA-binding transcriptional regulator, IclR family [Natribacillus halophilus]
MAKNDKVQSVERAIDLLFCFTISEPYLSMNDFIDKTGLNRTTIFRLLTSLSNKGLIEKEAISGRYKLGIPFVGFGQIVSESLDIRREALETMEHLSKDTGETTSLNVIQDERRVCIEKSEGSEDIKHFVKLGVAYPIVKGASGMIFLAFSTQEFTEKVLQNWECENNEKINRTDYYKNLSVIRDEKFAVSQNDRVVGAYSVSAPIFEASGKILGGLTISGPTSRFNEKLIVPKVKAGAEQISKQMGYGG